MPKITPFAAVRPTRDKAALVTSRSYDDYPAAELASQLDFNPFSFLHVLHPGYVNVTKNDPQKRFGQVRSRYVDFKTEQILKQENSPVFYVYEIQTPRLRFTGIIAGVSLDDYHQGRIKKHEDTLEYRVEQFEQYLEITGFNTEPVLLAYPHDEALQQWISETSRRRPLYSFSSPNRDKHTLWRINKPDAIRWLQEQFARIPALYIADGHHRTASAALLRERYRDSGNGNVDHFMAFLISEEQVKIYEYNRVVRDLNGFSQQRFLSQLERVFEITDKKQELWKPVREGEFGMYLGPDFYALRPRKEIPGTDAQFLYDELLAPLLGIGDLRNDGRIEYIPGNQPLTRMKEMVDSGDFAVGFSLFPIKFAKIRELSDRDAILPPKSTYIEPKFRSGLIIYEL